jgi:hypothetical protein
MTAALSGPGGIVVGVGSGLSRERAARFDGFLTTSGALARIEGFA